MVSLYVIKADCEVSIGSCQSLMVPKQYCCAEAFVYCVVLFSVRGLSVYLLDVLRSI